VSLNDIHAIMFNAYILFSAIMAVWAAVIAGRNQSISGNYWGSVATLAILAVMIAVLGTIMALQGLRPRDGRLILYFLYMAWLIIIMPGLFSLLRGRDDRSAALSYAILAGFNAAVGYSMIDREIIGPWVE
jgi:putative exporter of polyketide antibiotics